MLEKGNYIPWESRFKRFLDNKLEDDEMWYSIQIGPYKRPMIPNPDNAKQMILEPLSKMTEVDACKNAKDMWERIKRLMFGSDVTSHVRHSRLMNEFDKFTAIEGESLESVYERLTTLVNIMDRNNIHPILVSINTKFLNCLQPEWRKYVTMVCHNQIGDTVSYDVLYDSLVQFEPHVLASKAKKAAKNHDPLALLVHSHASSSQSHANSSYLPQPYYVTHPSSIVDYEDGYQGELQRDSQEDKLTTTMMLLARAITQKNARRQNKNQAFNIGNGNDDSNHIIQRVPRTESTLGKTVPSYDAKAVSEVNASSKIHEQADKDTIERILKEKDKIQSNFFKIENEKLIIQHETQLAKKAFKERENQYLEDIVDLEEKLVGYKNPKHLKKAITAQPKIYDGERLHSAKLIIDSPDSEETLEDAKESRLKMRNKMVQINYGKLNALYEIFVPQQEFYVKQTYFSIPSTYNNGSASKEVTSDLPILKMPKESKLLKMFDTLGVEINSLRTRTDNTLLEDIQRRWMSDSQNSVREFYKTNVIPMSVSLSKNLKELKEDLIEQNQDLLITISELKNKLQTVDTGKTVNTKNSSVKTALFTTPAAAKSKNLGATSVVAKSRLSVAKTTIATNKVSSVLLLSSDSSQSLGHNLFLVGQFFYGDLEVAFRSNTCYVRNLEDDDLLIDSSDSNLYTISIFEMAASSQVCLMSIVTSIKSWLWHRKLSHFNFGIINQLTSKDLVDGLPKFKYNKDHLCLPCEQGKSKKASFPLKLVLSTKSKLELLHMDLCGLMRVAVPSKKDLDNLFGPLYEEYYATSSPKVSDNSSANTLDNENTSSSSSIVVEEDEAPQIVSSLAEQVATEPNSPVLNENADEFVQEDVADFDRNVFYNAPLTPMFEEDESSLTYQDP
ncbi:retrovirus-related pol polyprotein from transposon TNT 1-94 [Tanacetum coccineum]|uniref:Retrovirus-related pol polyprotein from transposon TNT 1-94 n=1 Tax=Tanacetum coccineum TaxID=301880 RepID=A0ABQ5GBJ5_9ASTR